MATYSIGRRRVILALLLTAALLVTLDLNGTPVFDRARDVFARVMDPVEAATGVVTNPIERTWRAITEFDDLEEENLALQDQVDRLIGTQAAAEASVLEYQELQALFDLPSLSGIETEVAQVIGRSSNNLDQVVEINRGSNDNLAIGMAVVNQAGLIGRITSLTDETAQVMLISDPRYVIAVEVVAGTGEEGPERPPNTSPSGLTPRQQRRLATTTTVASETTLSADDVETDTTLPSGTPSTAPGATTTTPPTTTVPEEGEAATTSSSTTSTTTTTTTTVPARVEKEFGALEGRGRDRLPQIRFVQDTPSLAVLEVGDLVETAGGSESLAPPNIPVGRVVNRADRPGVGGPLLEVEPHADLDKLNFVRVVLFRPLSEVEQ
jgi:rod shape-determining protein MreC